MEEVFTGFRLAPQQRRVWRLQQDGAAPRAQCALSLEGRLAPGALREAVGAVVRRHDVLRTTFARVPGMSLPVQVVADDATLSWREAELRAEGPAERDALIATYLAEDAALHFHGENWPAARFLLLSFSESSHALLATLSPLCADSLTLDNLAAEVAATYGASLRGEVTEAEEPVQYAQFSEWQNELLEGDEGEAEREFWRSLALKAEPAPALPLEGRPAPDSRGVTSSVPVELGEALARRVAAAALGLSVEPDLFILACWQSLVQRLTGQASVTTHVLCDGRVYEEMQGGLGLYARWPFVRSAFAPDSRFDEVVTRLAEARDAATERQEYYSWEECAALSAVEPEPGLPLAYGFEAGTRPAALHVAGVEFSTRGKEACAERFKLRLSCSHGGGGPLGLTLHFDTEFYGAEAAACLAAQLREVIEGAAADPRVKVDDLRVLSEGERLALASWNSTRREYPRDRRVHELFEEQAARTPDAPAVVFKDERLTYRELNQRAERLAARLRGLGVGADVPVVLFTERSAAAVVGLLGILKAGGAFVPVDPAYPGQRVAFMVEDSGAPVLLTQERLLGSLPAHRARVVCVDAEGLGEGFEADTPRPAPRVTPDNLAYVIYTSGSTGRPKGVAVRHGSVVNLSAALREAVYAGQGTALRVSVNASLSFDSSVKQLVQLLDGHCLHIVPEEVRLDAEALAEFVRDNRLDVLDCTPSQLRPLLAAGLTAQGLKLVLVGGEAIDETTWKTLAGQSGVTFYNVYGPTECTVDTTVCRITAGQDVPVIGRPVSNAEVHVLDARMRPVPVGVAGELYIGGDGLARGYLGRPALTAEKFVPNPFAGGGRLYRTGDLVRHLPDGQLEFLGRIDNQVKVRGFRIELGEIEAALRGHAEVREAAVVVREDGERGKRLVACVVAAGGAAEGLRERLRERLRGELPEYMVPGSFTLLDALPLTPNGKVDRRALESLPAEAEAERAYEAPRTPTEAALCAVWGEVLGVGRVGIRDDFFALGGHSLLATQVVSRIRHVLDVTLPLRVLFQSPTVESLAACVEKAAADVPGRDESPALGRRETGDAPLLSYAQQRLWFLDQLTPNSPLYVVPTVLRMSGPLDLDALTRAINEVVRRHEVLRTNFVIKEGEPVQVIAPTKPLELPLVDLGHLPAGGREAEAARRIAEEARRPFDLTRDAMVRATLLRLGREEHTLLFTMHHVVSDDWSKGVLVREAAALYEAFSQGRPSPLPELPIQYADYAAWQREHLSGETLEEQLGYWRRELGGGLPVLNLPTDHTRPASPSHRGARLPFALDAELTEALTALARDEGSTLFMVLLAGFSALLSRYSGQEDVVVGSPIANRTRRETEDLIGFFVNTLALRTDLSGNPTFRELLARVREVTLGAYQHQDVPFERLVEDLQLSRGLGEPPLLQAVFTLQNAPAPPLQLAGLTLEFQPVESGTAKFDLVLNLAETERGLRGWLEYSCDLFEETTAERMQEHFRRLLSSIVARPDALLDDLELLTDEEILHLEEVIEEEAELEVCFSF